MTTKLTLYNGALREMGERKLASLTEEREPRYVLDEVWDEGIVDFCLADGQWTFATRTSRFEASTSIEPDFGLAYAFELPDDYVNTSAICTDPYFRNPLLEYEHESGFIYSDYDSIYMKYISNDAEYGTDYSSWPFSFINLVQGNMALRAVTRITSSKVDKADLEKTVDRYRKIALNHDMRKKPTRFSAPGSWLTSRLGGGGRNSNPSSIVTY